MPSPCASQPVRPTKQQHRCRPLHALCDREGLRPIAHVQTLPSIFRQFGLGRCQPTDSLTHSVRGLLQFCRLILHHAQHSLHASSCDSGLPSVFWAHHSHKEVILFIFSGRAALILCHASWPKKSGKVRNNPMEKPVVVKPEVKTRQLAAQSAQHRVVPVAVTLQRLHHEKWKWLMQPSLHFFKFIAKMEKFVFMINVQITRRRSREVAPSVIEDQ